MNFCACLQVNINGVISFNRPWNLLPPVSFPINDEDIIAAYWTNIDIRNSGNVFFRESTDNEILLKITNEIKIVDPRLTEFKALWAFIATWDNVLLNTKQEV